ncbi:MAG: dNTP triphosphohydrolase, partial [Atopobiaceae bacterium]|nr:dNTP triphosphohydrolase [Atopobiaceae bacterium]
MHEVTSQELERRERELLSPDAACSASTLGRLSHEEPDPYRTAFQCDRDRILHCKSFRRLAHKTQVFLAPEGDHYRTRLAHTLEVSQISRSISRALALNEDLTEAIALGHDLGHTPFGHCGEKALSKAMAAWRRRERGEEAPDDLFRHNLQSVRIVELLERNGTGLNLTFETVDGIRCHTGITPAVTLEGRVVALADRIAYVVHDIDDAERAGILSESSLHAAFTEVLGTSSSQRIGTMVNDVIAHSAQAGDISMSPDVLEAMLGMRTVLFDNLYTHGDAKYEEPKAAVMISELFDHFIEHMDEV